MDKVLVLALATMIAGSVARAGSFEAGGSFARWDETTLTVGNGLFSRTYCAVGRALRTISFSLDGESSFIKAPDGAKAEGRLSVSCESRRPSPVGVEALDCTVTLDGRKTTIRVFPGVAGVVTFHDWVDEVPPPPDGRDYRAFIKDGWSLRTLLPDSDSFVFRAPHLRITEFNLVDQTDVRDNLLRKREWITPTVELPERLTCSAVDVRDLFSDGGLVFLRLAPMPVSRPESVPDFLLDANFRNSRFVPLANGYPLAELLYHGGEAGRIAALQSLQRAYRPYRPGRDGIFLSNTWGGGNCDSRINADFLMAEVRAGAELGVDVIQIDDGWQQGRTSNSMKQAKDGKKKVWNGYWAVDPDFWVPDATRFPEGLAPLVAAAKAKGMGFGLWFAPDTSADATNWERDADCLLDFYRRLGIRYFKLDSLKLLSKLAFDRNRKMFDKLLVESDGGMVFDLDSTAETRPGYFGALDIGPIFVENRYAKRSYRPWSTLRNLWQLAQVVDPVRLRMEVVDPDPHPENCSPEDPLSSDKWPKDALFALAMVASPLGWMELSQIRPERMTALKRLVSVWRRERAALHGGVTFPVGAEPDGRAWTGFLTRSADGRGGYALLFREANPNKAFRLDAGGYFDRRIVRADVIGGRGSAGIDPDGRTLSIEVPAALDFVWLKLSCD